jgi:guanosine-3',5'-bis(diphosphate) 3'-pyrophosphohydrolase
VALFLAQYGLDADTIVAALLHDTVEDTETTFDELEAEFGAAVTSLVRELTDDKALPRKDRKRLQVDRAPAASRRAKCLKIADKVCNIRDVTAAPPVSWSLERRREYLAWAKEVVDGCRGVEPGLDAIFDDALDRGKRALVGE